MESNKLQPFCLVSHLIGSAFRSNQHLTSNKVPCLGNHQLTPHTCKQFAKRGMSFECLSIMMFLHQRWDMISHQIPPRPPQVYPVITILHPHEQKQETIKEKLLVRGRFFCRPSSLFRHQTPSPMPCSPNMKKERKKPATATNARLGFATSR